jgi:ASPIC and UnbV./FG-GAP repeat.
MPMSEKGAQRMRDVSTAARCAVFFACATIAVFARVWCQTGHNPRPHDSTKAAPATNSTSRLSTSSAAQIAFRDIGRQAGLTAMPHSTTERRYILETMSGGGIALFDCDNDGRLDIAVVSDSTIDRYKAGGDPMVTLYRQDGSHGAVHFTDVTSGAGLTTRGWGMAIAIGDFDNDGLPDMYVTGFGHNVLYRNIGGCKFQDVTDRAGVGVGGFSTGTAWADYDRDGYIDLFVARYVHVDLQHLPVFEMKGAVDSTQIIQAPDRLEGETDVLLRNRGDGTFEDVSVKAGVSDPEKFHGMGVTWGDYDADGWPDLLVTNDSGPNYLYHNLGNGKFEEVGANTGTAYGSNGEIYGNMAADFGDANLDGKLDLVVTRYSKQPASLYRNDGESFTDIAAQTKLLQNTKAYVKWGTGFGDFDNDGWPDILIANGNFSSLTNVLENEVGFLEPLQLFHNLQGSAFDDVADVAGLNKGLLQSRRGTAFGDINNDGNLDFVVFNVNNSPSLFINDSRNSNHRVIFQLVGSKSNRMAIGARVIVEAGGMSHTGEVRGGGGYNSSNDTRLHFGLGKNSVITKVEVRWPSGLRQEFKNMPADAIYEIDEGKEPRAIVALKPPAGL